MTADMLLAPRTIRNFLGDTAELSLTGIRRLMIELKHVGLSSIPLAIAANERIAYPFLNLFILLASIPFFFLRGKLSRFFIISFALLFSFFCHIVYSIGIAFAKNGQVPIWFGVWMVHFLILILVMVFWKYRNSSFFLKR